LYGGLPGRGWVRFRVCNEEAVGATELSPEWGGVTEQPSLILIMADDLGKECIGAYGCTEYETPVLDGLAKKGIRFDPASGLVTGAMNAFKVREGLG